MGAPDWVSKDRYDVAAVPDREGAPSALQVRIMIQKLLADRFKLTFHKEKKDLSAYVLTVVKNGQKMTPTQSTGPLPGIGVRPAAGGLALHVGNGSMADFTGFLQQMVLDRPVVDHTGIAGRYDFDMTFAPDDSQFNGHPPIPPKTDATAAVESAPSLYEAMHQQLGLKLDAEKTQVEVIAIDHVEKPSDN